MSEGRLRSADETLPQPWDRLAAYLSGQGLTLEPDPPPRQFADGLANLNYLVSLDGSPAVLRRPPAGPTAEGANDMAREWRVLSSLGAAYPLAPRGLHFCPDPDVIGAPFQLLEHRDGVAIGARLPAPLQGLQQVGHRLTAELIDAMARLHEVDVAAVGLGDLGRPDGFFERQVEGWARRASSAYPDGVPRAVEAIVAALRRAAPQPLGPVLLHCDVKFDNLLVDLATVRPVALVDWDMATRGDPRFDLAVLLSYWVEPGDPEALHAIEQVPSLVPGFPSRQRVAELYATSSGRALGDLSPFLTLARLRLGIVWAQLHRQHERGALRGARYAGLASLAEDVFEWTAEALR